MPEGIEITVVLATRLGPPQLFESGTEGRAASIDWWLVLGFVGVCLGGLVLARLGYRRVVGDGQVAFRMLARRLGLRRTERIAIERLAEREGVDPIGLLICESAFIAAANGRDRLSASVVEAKPVLLTSSELNELGRVGERLFGDSLVERLEAGRAIEEEADSHDDDERTPRWVA